MTETQPPPESVERAFRLRARPPAVTRLSRKVLAGLAGLALVGVGAALILALQGRPRAKTGEADADSDRPATAEILAGAPRDYSQIPRLGPPLPGDLGPPIRGAQRRGVDAAPPDRQTARAQADQIQAAARASGLFSASSGSARPPPLPAASAVDIASAYDPGNLAALASQGPEGGAAVPKVAAQAGNRAFITGRGQAPPALASGRLAPPASRFILQAGSLIPAALITGLRSDLPGQVTAQVTENVYDSPTGQILLIPQGARLIGQYNAEVAQGQRRALLVWTRLILPGGASIGLDREPATDAQGYAGLQDRTDDHWPALARASLVSTLLAIGAELGAGDDDPLATALRRGTQDSFNSAGQALIGRDLDTPPTLTIRPGYPVRVLVTRDLILDPKTLETTP